MIIHTIKKFKLDQLVFVASLFLLLAITAQSARAGVSSPGGYGLKIYQVHSALYPFVHVYFRTFDHNKEPLVNLNAMNIGLMVKGRQYDPMKRQYTIQTIRQRNDAVRSVIVLDASMSLNSDNFNTALKAAARFIDGKRPQDEVAVLAIWEKSKEGYELISNFERDPDALARRIADIKLNGTNSRIYDTIAAAMQMCAMSSQGSSIGKSKNYIASCSILVFSDGLDEGSALSREELNSRITSLNIPVPIYSLAYGDSSRSHFKNLESISKNSFGVYYLIGDTVNNMTRVVESVQNILLSDYVLVFRSNLDVDGEQHALKVGVEYPTGSQHFTYDSAKFEAMEALRATPILEAVESLKKLMPVPADGSPFYSDPSIQSGAQQ